MPTLGFLLEPTTTPAASRSVDAALLARAVERGRGVLRVSRVAGDVLALGRWHLAPRGAPDVTLHRRLTGGRAMAAGAGFVFLSLVLPHRSALVSDDPWALSPEQVLNRAVRGLMGALEAAGVSVVYPGRDVLTVARRMIAVLGLDVAPDGGTLVEACLAVERDQSLLPLLLDRADPDGVVGAQMTLPHDATSLAGELGRVPTLEEIAGWIRHGYERRLGVRFVEHEPASRASDEDDTFLRARAPRAALDRRGVTPTMLGQLEAHFALATDGTLGEVILAGDLLAPSDTVHRLEHALPGCLPSMERLEAVIGEAVRPPHHFVLGIGPLRTIAETIVRGLG